MPQCPDRAAEGRPKILVFCRPYLVEDFKENLKDLHNAFQFDFLTDGRCSGTRDTRAKFYAALRSSKLSRELTEDDLDQLTTRCRLLRNIDQTQARRLAHAMAVTLSAELEASAPQVVLSHWVDEYVTHLLSILARKRGIPYLGYAYSYFPGKAQLMQDAYGQPFEARSVSAEEVETAYREVSDRCYRQNYLQPPHYGRAQHLKYILRHRAKQLIFWAKSVFERDPWNVHYAITPHIVDRRRLLDYPPKSAFAKDWRSQLAKQKERHPAFPIVYLPLAYFPESAIDYWVQDRRILDYENVMLDAIGQLRKHCIVVVKEHLHMLGARNPRFYAALNNIPGIVSVHPAEYSNDVLEASDAVLLGAGSVGLEATMRKKPILSYCPTSFWFDAAGATEVDLGDIGNWHRIVKRAIVEHEPMDAADQRDFIRTCLQSTVRHRGQGKRWLLIEGEDLRTMLEAVVSNGSLAATSIPKGQLQ